MPCERAALRRSGEAARRGVVALGWTAGGGRRGCGAGRHPKLFYGREVADALHVLGPVVGLRAAPARESAIEPEDPLAVEQKGSVPSRSHDLSFLLKCTHPSARRATARSAGRFNPTHSRSLEDSPGSRPALAVRSTPASADRRPRSNLLCATSGHAEERDRACSCSALQCQRAPVPQSAGFHAGTVDIHGAQQMIRTQPHYAGLEVQKYPRKPPNVTRCNPAETRGGG